MKTTKTIIKKIAKEIHRVFIKRPKKFIKRKCVNFFVISFIKIPYKFYKCSGVVATSREIPLIVTLTSYGPRLSTAYLSISTLLCQKVKPDRVILWLAHGEKIPKNLTKLCERGLEIRYCDDLKSFTKIIPALKTYPNAILVTADDDVFYNSRWLEKLYNSYLSDPSAIWAQRAYPARLVGPEKLIPFSEMLQCYKSGDKYDFLFLCTGAGLLIPPLSLPEKVLEVKIFQSLCYSCDDTWITAMAILKDSLCRVVSEPYSSPRIIPQTQKVSLFASNKYVQDIIIHKVFKHFNLYEQLSKREVK